MATGARSLKLMTDYDCHPLWAQNESGTDNIAPASLPLSPGLRDALDAWAWRYDDTFDRDDPRRSGFSTPQAEAAFKAEGQVLLDRLKAELGEGYTLVLQT